MYRILALPARSRREHYLEHVRILGQQLSHDLTRRTRHCSCQQLGRVVCFSDGQYIVGIEELPVPPSWRTEAYSDSGCIQPRHPDYDIMG